MASQFENAGLGNFGREGQFSRGGPINELVKLLPAFGAAYGLVKSGAVDKLNADNWLSNPKKAMSNAILGSAPPADVGKSGIAPSGAQSISEPASIPMDDNYAKRLSAVNAEADSFLADDTSAQAVATQPVTKFDLSGASSAPINSGNPQQSNFDNAHQENSNAVHQVFPTGSPITVDPLKETNANQTASSDAALANAYAPPDKNAAANPAGSPSGGSDIGAQIGLSILSKFLAL